MSKKAESKSVLHLKIDALNKQIETLVRERDALYRLSIGDFNEVITDAEYSVVVDSDVGLLPRARDFT